MGEIKRTYRVNTYVIPSVGKELEKHVKNTMDSKTDAVEKALILYLTTSRKLA